MVVSLKEIGNGSQVNIRYTRNDRQKASARVVPNAQADIALDKHKVSVRSDKTHETLAQTITDKGHQIT
jgi:hypothetical protein